jgi:TRAP-type C4-dicarboxylate transport system substrate-binding protein
MKRTVHILTVLALLLALAVPAAAATSITLRMSHNAGTGQSIDEATKYLAEIVRERSGGRIDLQIFPNNVLGPDLATRDMLMDGGIDLLALGAGFMSNWSGAISIIQCLYAFENEDELMEVMTGAFGQKYFYGPFLKERNARILDQWPQSVRALISTKPVRSLADLRGLKLRTPPGIPVWEYAWNRLGVMSVSLALEDAFTGMQQGVCDAVEMPIDFIRAYRFHEQAKYLTMTNHNYYTQFILVNENSWNKLSPEDQRMFTQAVFDAGAKGKELQKAGADEIMAEFKAAGVEVIELSPETLAEFQKTVEPVYHELMRLWGEEIYKDFTAAISQYRANHK